MNLTLRILCLFRNRKRIIYRPSNTRNTKILVNLLPHAISPLLPEFILKYESIFNKRKTSTNRNNQKFLKLSWLKIFFSFILRWTIQKQFLKMNKLMFFKIFKWKFCRFVWRKSPISMRRRKFLLCVFF